MIIDSYTAPVESTEPTIKRNKNYASQEEIEKAELRRLMYERIAQGHQLTEVEESAQKKWNNR